MFDAGLLRTLGRMREQAGVARAAMMRGCRAAGTHCDAGSCFARRVLCRAPRRWWCWSGCRRACWAPRSRPLASPASTSPLCESPSGHVAATPDASRPQACTLPSPAAAAASSACVQVWFRAAAAALHRQPEAAHPHRGPAQLPAPRHAVPGARPRCCRPHLPEWPAAEHRVDRRRSLRACLARVQDIYSARAAGELVLEEQLFRALLNIYRLPAVLFELTRKHRKTA